MWQQIASTVQNIIPALLNIIPKIQTTMMVWKDFQLTCPPGEWSVALLPGRCLVCRQDGFVVLRSDQGDVEVQCCECSWRRRVTPESFLGWLGVRVLLAADLLEVARVRCPEAAKIDVLPGQGVA